MAAERATGRWGRKRETLFAPRPGRPNGRGRNEASRIRSRRTPTRPKGRWGPVNEKAPSWRTQAPRCPKIMGRRPPIATNAPTRSEHSHHEPNPRSNRRAAVYAEIDVARNIAIASQSREGRQMPGGAPRLPRVSRAAIALAAHPRGIHGDVTFSRGPCFPG